MTAKEYLSQAFIIDRMINAKKNRLLELREMMQWSTSAASDIKVQTSLKPDPMGDLIVSLMDKIADCERDIQRLLDIQTEIENVVNSVNRLDYRLILYERYVNLKRWDDIAADNGYNLRHVYKIHGHALSIINNGIEWHSLDVI